MMENHTKEGQRTSKIPPQSLLGLNALITRWKTRLEIRQLLDKVWISHVLGITYLLLSKLPFKVERRLRLLVAATRRMESPALQQVAKKAAAPWLSPDRVDYWPRHRIGWQRYEGDFADIRKQPNLTTSLLLKEPGTNGEKGVIYCSFEFNWMKLLANPNARQIFNDYYLVGASSWSPTDHAVLANLCGISDDPIFIGVSNMSDMRQYKIFSDRKSVV